MVLAVTLNFGYKWLDKKPSHVENLMAVIYAVFSALFGTLSVVFAKLLAKLVELHFCGANVFGHWYTYVTLLSWLVLMSFWLYRLNAALGLYNPIFIIPLLQSNFIFFAIISGGVYFQEFNYMKETNWVGFVLGIISMFAGIFLLVPETPEVSEKDIKWHRQRSSNLIEVGISKDNMAKIFISAPAQMFEKKYLIPTEAVEYSKDTEKFQNANNSCTEKTAWMKKDYINYYTGEQLIKAEEKLKELIMRGKILSKAETESVRERIERWRTSLKDFELKVKKIEDINTKVAKVEMKKKKNEYEYESFVTNDENNESNLVERNVESKEEYANVIANENIQVGMSEISK